MQESQKSDKNVVYKCGRCGLTKNVTIKDIKETTKIQKTIKCPYCEPGRMRLQLS